MRGLLRHPLVWILFLALVLRVWGIDWQSHHPDEKNTVELGLKMLSTGTFLPEKMNYGSFPLYLQAALTWVLIQIMTVFPSLPGGSLGAAMSAGRTLSVAFSLGTVALTWGLVGAARCGEQPERSSRWQLGSAEALATLAMAVALLPVQIAHYATVDSQLAFLVTASLLWALKAERTRRLPHFLIAGVWAGLAGATKYTGVLVLAPLMLIPLIDPEGRRLLVQPLRRSEGWKKALAGALLSGPVFALAMPYALLRLEMLRKALEFESHHYMTGGETIFSMGNHTWLWNLDYLAHSALGPGLFLLSLGSMLALAWPSHAGGQAATQTSNTPTAAAFPAAWHRGRLTMLLLYVLLVYGFTARFPVRFDRNLLPILPLLCVFFGVGVERLLHHWPTRWKHSLVLATAGMCLAGSLERSVVFDMQLKKLHPKQAVKNWKKTLPPGVLVSDHGRSQTRSLGQLKRGGFTYAVMSSASLESIVAQPERYPVLSRQYPELLRACKVVMVFENPWFASDFFAPHRLLNSATINSYHGPTHWILEVPPKATSAESGTQTPKNEPKEAGQAPDEGNATPSPDPIDPPLPKRE